MYVMLVLTPSGQSTWSISLLSCSKKTISTNNALNMKKANTDLFLSSMRSAAIRACKQTLQHTQNVSTGLTHVACELPEMPEHRQSLLMSEVIGSRCHRSLTTVIRRVSLSFDVHRAVHSNIISTVKLISCSNVSNLFYFGMTLYLFRTAFPSIIRSSRLYIQQPNRYCCLCLTNAQS